MNTAFPVASRDRMIRETRWAMGLSLVVGLLMLAGKSVAYGITGSAAIFYHFAPSVVYSVAV